MSMKAILGTVLALLLAVGATAYLAARGVQAPPPPPPDISKGDQVYENPFDLKGPGPHPKAVVAETHYDFGIMALGGEQSRDFVFRNDGTAPLKLAKGRILCQCTIPTLETGEIPPGSSAKVTLTWKPTAAQKEFVKEADIWTNDPANPKITLSINGSVFIDPTVVPGSFMTGDFKWDEEHHSQAIIYSTTSDDLTISGYDTNDPQAYDLKWTKLSPEELEEKTKGETPKPLAGYALDLAIKPNGSAGTFQGWVKLKVNRKDGEKNITIGGTRVGVIHLHGPDYQAGLSLLDLRRFKSDQGGKSTIFLRFDSIGEDLVLKKIESASGNLTATLTKEPSGGGKKDFYKLEVDAKKGIATGTTFSIDNPDVLTITTNHPQIPVFTFKVRYIVQ